MTRKYVTSVADAYGYDDSNGTLLFEGKTLIDDSVATTVGSTDIRGGKGNQLLYKYYHTSAMAIKITDAQWNLDFLAATTGTTIQESTSVYTEETVAVTSGAGSVAGTPLTISGAVYGWVTLPNYNSSGVALTTTLEKVIFSTKAFTLAVNSTYTGNVCVRYYGANTSARYIQIPANIIPKRVRLVLEAQLVSAQGAASNVIGSVQFLIPDASLSGAFTIALTSGGVSTTPIDAVALASEDLMTGACSEVPLYCQVTEILTSTNWYDNVYALAVSGGDFSLATGGSPHTIVIYALAPNSAPFIPPVADLTFSSGTEAKATIGLHTGIVTWVASGGTSLLTAYITAKSTIETSCTVTTT